MTTWCSCNGTPEVRSAWIGLLVRLDNLSDQHSQSVKLVTYKGRKALRVVDTTPCNEHWFFTPNDATGHPFFPAFYACLF